MTSGEFRCSFRNDNATEPTLPFDLASGSLNIGTTSKGGDVSDDPKSTTEPGKSSGTAIPFAERINQVDTTAPWQWLALGWADLRQARWISVPYAFVFVVIGYGVTLSLHFADKYYLIWPFVAGFILVAPVFTVGFYEISRQLERGEQISFTTALNAWRRAPGRIFGAGLALTFFLIIWIRTAALLYVINFPYKMLTLPNLLNQTFFSVDGLTFLAIGTFLGAIFAVFAYLLSAVSLPMMVGERADFLPALLTSIFAVTLNPRAMILWAAIIVVVTAVGLATAFVGLAITLPLIGHATWHAYRSLVRPKDSAN